MQGRKIARVLSTDCVFFECDIQEKMRKLIKNFDTVAHNAKRLTQVAKILDIPVISTKQTPKTFGDVISELKELHFDKVKVFEKQTFSMLEEPVLNHLTSLNKKKVVLYGIEAHVCMKQTCLDLLALDYDVHLVIDACSSMNYHDRTVGIESMRDAGASITTF